MSNRTPFNSPARTLINPLSTPAVPWNNGGGSTREIAVSPLGADFQTFDWRLSVADVIQSGPFSRLPGVDRHFLVASDGSVRLTADGQATSLALGSVAAFRGEADVSVDVLKGPTRNLNLMTRRGRCRGSINVYRLSGPLAVGARRGPVALLLLAGGLLLESGAAVERLHVLMPGPDEEHIYGEDALIASVHVTPEPGTGRVTSGTL